MRIDIGSVTLDTERRQIFRGADSLHLSPKAFQLLQILAENRPRALSKDELQGLLWPETFVSDTSLTTLVNELRTQLEETDREASLIRTVHRYGYALADEATSAPATGHRLYWGAHEVPLAEGENVLGRDLGSMGLIPDASMSRRHARITVRGETATLEDLESKNGTWLGEARVTFPTALADGDAIRLGLVQLVFRAARNSRSTSTQTVR